MRSLREKIATRSVVVLVLLFGVFFAITSKYFFVMVVRPMYTSGWSQATGSGQHHDVPRGKITDTFGNILATSVQKLSLYANPQNVVNPWTTARQLAPFLNSEPPELYRRLNYDRHFIWLERKLDDIDVRRIRELDLPGIGFRAEYERVYPHGALAAQLLGIVGLDNEGLEGLERQYNDFLLDKRGSGDADEFLSDELPEIKLSLSQTVQHIVEEELVEMARRERPINAMVVVMDPKTGNIIAMANWPTYDPNRFSEYPEFNIRNRAVGHSFEPGSTLKVMTISAGLSEDVYETDSTFGCDAFHSIAGTEHTLKCYAAHGAISVPEILIKSCNVGTAKAVSMMEPGVFYRNLREFGFGNWTGIKLPGEARGSLRRPHRWSRLTQPSMAIGQGISVTALQLTTALSAVVNDGVLLRPRLVTQLKRGNEVLDENDKFEVRRILPSDVAFKMQNYMEQVVSRGTGQQAYSSKYRLAGKTGTAQKADMDAGGYYEDRVLASFIGFGPVDEPRLVTTVIVDEPQDGRYGGEVAAPVFKRIMERSLRYLDNVGS